MRGMELLGIINDNFALLDVLFLSPSLIWGVRPFNILLPQGLFPFSFSVLRVLAPYSRLQHVFHIPVLSYDTTALFLHTILPSSF